MSSRNNRRLLNLLVTIPVAVIVLVACALSAMAMRENMRFLKTTEQIVGFVGSVRGAALQQASFAQYAGEDLWDALALLGRINKDSSHKNAWNGDLRMMTVPVATGTIAMRLENDLPTRECRRLAVYFVGRQSDEMGIVSIEAQTIQDAAQTQSPENGKWILVYPLSIPVYEKAALFACGKKDNARLAVTFKIR